MEWLWWVAAGIVCALVEVISLTLVLLMFAGGALAAALVAALGGGIVWQVITFAVVSTVLVFALRPWLLRHWRTRTPLVETNVDAQVGRIALVVDEVTEGGGRVKIAGEVWSARTDPGSGPLSVGSEVRVVRIEGATAVVAPQPASHTTY